MATTQIYLLQSERMQFKYEKEQLQSERRQLQSERRQLQSERRQLKAERDLLLTERSQLLTERKLMQAEYQETRAAWRKIVALQTQLLTEMKDKIGNRGSREYHDMGFYEYYIEKALKIWDLAAPVVKYFR
ncbi:uncharacterized protein ACNLHF_002138 [Anomaloglossus baeobatrachus]